MSFGRFLGAATGFRPFSRVIRARNTRQLGIFPLATTTVGWVLDRTPGGPKRSGGLGAKRRVVRAGCRLRMKLRKKMHRVIYPENKICVDRKTGFLTVLRILCSAIEMVVF
jgi:hypothetical protein